MKRKLAILLTIVCFLGVGALCVMFDIQDTQAANNGDSAIVLPDDSLMLVIWSKADEQYVLSIRGPATFVIDGNKLYYNDQLYANNKHEFAVYPWQYIPDKYCEDDDGEPVSCSWYMDELDLQPIGADDLPHSQHIAKLIGIDQQAAKPAIVARKFLGEVYTVNCLVSQSAFDMYLAGDLELGDYVIVSFIDEIPDTTELNIAIVVDKVVDTWSK